jgi:hypothetical protein
MEALQNGAPPQGPKQIKSMQSRGDNFFKNLLPSFNARSSNPEVSAV